MKITLVKHGKDIEFHDLNIGDVFRFSNNDYVRVNSNGGIYNAMALLRRDNVYSSPFTLLNFPDFEVVEYIGRLEIEE